MAKKSTNKPWAARIKAWEEQAASPLPPSGDWERLANKMELEKKRPPLGASWLWWAVLGLLAVGLLFTYLYSRPTSPNQEAPPAVPLVFTPPLAASPEPQTANSISDPSTSKGLASSSLQASPPAPKSEREASPINKDIQGKIHPTTSAARPFVSQAASHVTSKSSHRGTELPSRKPPIALAEDGFRPLGQQPAAEYQKPWPIAFLATIAPPTPSRAESPLPLPKLRLAASASSPDLDQGKQHKWAVGATFILAQNNLSASSNSPSLRPIGRSQKQGLRSGLTLSARLGNRWGLQLGISRGREEVTSRYRFQRIYTPSTEHTTSEGAAVNDFSVELEGKYAKTTTDIEISRLPNQPAGPPTRLLVEAQLKEKLTVSQIPLLLTYDLPLGNRLSLQVGSGMSWQQNKINTEQQARLVQAGRFQLRRSRTLSREAFVKESLWLGQANLGLNYQLAKRWSAISQVNAYTQIGTSQTNDASQTNYQGVSGQMTLLYHF